MPEKTDKQLVALARSGRKQAFGQLIDRHGARARRLARDMVGGDEDAAQEMAQEAFVRAWLSLEHLRDGALFSSWLCGIVVNVCRGYLREQRTMRGLADKGGFLPPSDPQRVFEAREQQRVVQDAIESLSPENQAATRLFYDEQRSLQEIADALGISVAAVKGRLHKSRQALRERLRPHYPDLEYVMPSKQRRKRMVKVSVTGVYMHQEEGRPPQHFVLLADETTGRLRIWVGLTEARAISFALVKEPTERPMTMDLMVNLLREAGATLEEVRIEAIKEETFYAVLKMRFADGVREMDARPSDALALALHMDSPIFVAQNVMESGEKQASHDPATGEASLLSTVLLAPVSTDEAALRGMAQAILGQAIHEEADQITFGSGLGQVGVHVLYRIGGAWRDAPVLPPLPRTMLRPLVEVFQAMTAEGEEQTGETGFIPVQHAGQTSRAYVSAMPSGHSETVLIRIERSPQLLSGAEEYADEDAVRRLSSAILGQAIREGASQIIVGLGEFVSAHIEPDKPGASRIYFEGDPTTAQVHVLYWVGDEWRDAMTLPKASLKPLAGRFMLMSTYGAEEMWHVPLEYQGKMYDAHVTVTPGQHGEAVHIALREKSPESSEQE